MRKDVTFLVGNGFNWFTYAYMVSNEEEVVQEFKKILTLGNEIERKEYFDECTKSLKDYIQLFDKIRIDGIGVGGEILLEKIFDILYEHNVEEKIISEVETSIKEVIKSKIESSTIKSKSNKNIYVNATIRNVFWTSDPNGSDVSFTDMLSLIYCKNNDVKINVLTTNYDENVRSVFTERRYPKGKYALNKNVEYMGIHGNYSDKKYNMVLTSPERKTDHISGDCLSFLKESLQVSKTIILFGLGLESDPHILEELNKVTNSNVIIIDSTIDKFLNDSNKRFDFIHQNSVFFIDTLNNSLNGDKITPAAKTPTMVLDRLKKINLEKDNQ